MAFTFKSSLIFGLLFGALGIAMIQGDDSCKKPLGMQSLGIDNYHLKVTSESKDRDYGKISARLGFKYAWRSKDRPSTSEYLQVDLGQIKKVTGIAIQGDPNSDRWVTVFKINYSIGDRWIGWERFKGPKSKSDTAKIWFPYTIQARHIQINPLKWRGGISMRIELYGCENTCDNQPVGLENGHIKQSQISASSILNDATPAQNCRLGYNGADSWCGAMHDNNTYLQIDLRMPHVICAISTQGNSKRDHMVTSFTIQTSIDGKKWIDYRNKPFIDLKNKVKNVIQTFKGNFDSNSIAKNYFDQGLLARYVRILPKTFIGAACMRVELFGVEKTTCNSKPSGIGLPFPTIPDHRFSASSTYKASEKYKPHAGRTMGTHCWEPLENTNPHDYLEIDLGAPHIVCGIGIQGTGQDFRIDEKTRDYYIEFSLDGVDWHIVLPSEEGIVSFQGNLKREQDYPGDVYIKKNIFTDKNLLVARFYRIYPLNFDGHKCVRTELYGLRQEWRGSLGLETIAGKSNVFDQQITASSFLDKHTTPPKARLYSPSSWCAKTKGSYLQIDMKKVQEFRGLAFHADARDNNKRVLEFELQYGYDHSKLTRTKIKTELTAKKEIKSYWLPRPANARYVRIQPTKWHNKPCIRTELYVNNVRGPPVTIQSFNLEGKLTATPGSFITAKCSASGDKQANIKWLIGGLDVTDKSDGSVYADKEGLRSSKLQINFTSVLDVKSTFQCESLDRFLMNCSTMVDCLAYRFDANGDRRRSSIWIVIDIRPPTDPPTQPPATLKPAIPKAPSHAKRKHKRKHNKPLPPPKAGKSFDSSTASLSTPWRLCASIALCMLGWLVN